MKTWEAMVFEKTGVSGNHQLRQGHAKKHFKFMV